MFDPLQLLMRATRSFRKPVLPVLASLAKDRRVQVALVVLVLLSGGVGSYFLFAPPSQARLMDEARTLAESGDCARSAVKYRQVLAQSAAKADTTPLWLGACYES